VAFRCLADFLEDLLHGGQLARVDAEVDAREEVAQITRRIAGAAGPALLFGAVKGHDIPLLTNLLGTESRICHALGIASVEDLVERIAEVTGNDQAAGWLDRLKAGVLQTGLAKLAPRTIRSGPCHQVVRVASDVDLADLPIPRSASDEPAPVITAAVVVTSDPETGRQSVGRYDLQVLDARRLALCFDAHDPPSRQLAAWQARPAPMPVAVVLGGDVAGLLAACTALPETLDTYAFAGLLGGKPLELVTCREIDLQVPADAEFVLEGTIEPGEPKAAAGPMGTPLGYYRPATAAPVMRVAAVTHRTNPVLPAMVMGTGPNEAATIASVMSRVMLPVVRAMIPELVDCDLPSCGTSRHWALASIHKTYPGQARKVAHALWGLRQFAFAKMLVVVDATVDVHDREQVLAEMAARVQPPRDVFFAQGPPDPWDPATPQGMLGQQMGIDATTKLPEETQGLLPPRNLPSDTITQLVADRWEEYGLGPDPASPPSKRPSP